jgi:hypothetical protein
MWTGQFCVACGQREIAHQFFGLTLSHRGHHAAGFSGRALPGIRSGLPRRPAPARQGFTSNRAEAALRQTAGFCENCIGDTPQVVAAFLGRTLLLSKWIVHSCKDTWDICNQITSFYIRIRDLIFQTWDYSNQIRDIKKICFDLSLI